MYVRKGHKDQNINTNKAGKKNFKKFGPLFSIKYSDPNMQRPNNREIEHVMFHGPVEVYQLGGIICDYKAAHKMMNTSDMSEMSKYFSKLRPKYRWKKMVQEHKECKVDPKNRRNDNTGELVFDRHNATNIANMNGACVPKAPANNFIHHFTEEYYLSYLTKYYDFSLTHNDLLSIEKNHIPIVLNKINDYFKSIDEKLVLEHIEVIDHNIYRNKYFLFCFSKVFIKAKMRIDTELKHAYSTEFVAFSKYPHESQLSKMISDVSRIIYDSLIEQNLDINARLIDMKKEPENQLVFTRVYGNQNEAYSENITIKNMNLSKQYYPFLDIDILVENFYNSDDKLLLLYGENGSGKTKLSNLLATSLQNKKYEIVILSGSDIQYEKIISHMEWLIFSNLSNSKELCVIIDDIDPKYLNRNHDDKINIFFNKLLTILDGNFESKLKFIITTNHILKEDEDDPLYRAGRLFDSIYIRYLTKQEASYILKNNKINDKNIELFLNKQKDKIKQSDVAQYILNCDHKITKSYYKDKEIETKISQKKIGLI